MRPPARLRTILSGVAAVTSLLLGVLLSGCGNGGDLNPVSSPSPGESSDGPIFLENPSFRLAVPLGGDDDPGFVTGFIEADVGGEVQYGRFTVRIPAGALSEDAHITIRDPKDRYVLCELEPHGLQFNVPVEFEVDLAYTDHSGYDDWTIWWLNEQTGSWENEGGTLDGELVRTQLEHFSTYGPGRAGW